MLFFLAKYLQRRASQLNNAAQNCHEDHSKIEPEPPMAIATNDGLNDGKITHLAVFHLADEYLLQSFSEAAQLWPMQPHGKMNGNNK
jgi:hypothetical protein